MKNVTVAIGLATLLLAGEAQANDITIKPKGSGGSLLFFYVPKVASDGIQNVATIAETGTGLSPFQTELGTYQALTPSQVSWTGIASYLYGPTKQIGANPSIALAFDGADDYDAAIEVHQGGQDSESSLWFQLGSNAPPFFSAIHWGDAAQLGPGPWHCGPFPLGCGASKFDYGYHPTVAADLEGSSSTSTTVVEVHQADTSGTALYYHVGVLTLGPSPSISWGPSLQVGTAQGSVPTVSVANNVAVLVAEGSGGALWYSVGVVDTATSTIVWTAPAMYGSGYNPTVSVYGDGTDLWIPGRVLVEAHQVDSSTGSLVYSAGVLNGSSPTSIAWSTTTNVPYATGCYPSLALAFDGYTPPSQVSVTETHATVCGSASTTDFWFGYLIGK